MRVDAEVKQISTGQGAYINVLRQGLDGGRIAVWGHAYSCPTYLLLRGDTWLLVVFDDKAWRNEGLPELIRTWAAEKVIEIPSMIGVTYNREECAHEAAD